MRLLWSIMIMAVAITAQGTTYYVRSDGSDSNNGRSWSSAKRTINGLEAVMHGGDTAFFAPNQIFRGQLDPVSGTANAPTYYISGNGVDNTIPTSYTNNRASLWGSEDLSNQTWTVYSGNIWRTNYTPQNTAEFGDFEMTCWVLSQYGHGYDTLLHPRSAIPDAAGQMYYDPGNHVMYAWMFGNENPNNYDTLEASWLETVRFENQDHVVIQGFDIRYAFQAGVSFRGNHADSNLVYLCNVRGCGQTNAANVAGIGSYSDGTARVDTNYVEYVTGWGNVIRGDSVSLCVAPSMWTHRYGIGFYGQQGALVESCYVAPGFFYGIKFKGCNSFGKIQDNHILMDAVEDCAGIQFTTQDHFDTVCGNVIVGGTYGYGISIENKYDTVSNIAILNNTLYNTRERAFQVDWGDNGGETKGNNVFKYNVIYNVDGAGSAWRGGIISSPHVNLRYWDIDSNLIYNPGEYRWMVGGTYVNQSTWQNTYHFDTNSEFNVDPQFADPANWDFSRANAVNEINVSYGGRDWTIMGAVQSDVVYNCTDPEPSVLLGPANNASYDVLTTQEGIITLTWSADNSGQPVTYRVEIADDPSFNIITYTTEVSNNSLTVGGYGSNHLEDGTGTTHYWRVFVLSGSCVSQPSSSRSFVLQDLAPPDWPQ